MKASRNSGAVVGAIGLLISGVNLILFWAFTPVIFASLLIGLPAAGYTWLTGWRRLALIGFVVALTPITYLSVEAGQWPPGLVALICAAVTVAVVWLIDRRTVRGAS